MQGLNDYLLAAWFVAGVPIAYWLIRRSRACYQAVFPSSDASDVQFRENGASGRSLHNLLTRLGGASNALEVIITTDELWIRLIHPVRLLFSGVEYDLLHRVPKQQIRSLEEKRVFGRRVALIEFIGRDGKTHRVELALRRLDDFLAALTPAKIAG